MTQEIAQTIIKQMQTTNGRLIAMLGANLLLIENGLQINFKGCRKADRVQIVLNGKDLYDMTFFKFNKRTYECPVTEQYEDVYWDMLKELFEGYTGLYVSL